MRIKNAFIITSISALMMLAVGISGCTSGTARFAARPPVQELGDQQPIPVPGSTRYIRMEYYYKVLVRRPASRLFDFSPLATGPGCKFP